MSPEITLERLVESFAARRAEITAAGSKYDEANTRVDYINHLFELMGWDVNNYSHRAETEVVHEYKMKIKGMGKRPDYGFMVKGKPAFFVEAKKPSVKIKDNASVAYQLRAYAHTKKLPLSIITDFEEFAVYDTRIPPKDGDGASVARVWYFTFDQYMQPPEKIKNAEGFETVFDFIKSIFSKDAVEAGSLEQWTSTAKKLKGVMGADKGFLALLKVWRENLADEVAKHNLSISVRDLNTVVQRLIDRLVFLRFAEDRGAEVEDTLLNLANSNSVREDLNKYFDASEKKYNSELFAFNPLLRDVVITDKKLKEVIMSMYQPQCPYIFEALPIEILGAAYEMFLGQTITISGGEKRHKATVRDKPEVVKAGGVVYTPEYIVDYIVDEVVGPMVSGKTPEQVASVKIVDPACGSGSFLIGALDYLLDWYTRTYLKDEVARKNAMKTGKLIERESGVYKLSLKEKRRILTQHIYGVDIDAQAVEVTKLSLCLRLVEDETMSGGQASFGFNEGRILPNLEANIKCGNSIIEPDYFVNHPLLTEGIDPEELQAVNAFDWKSTNPDHTGFPDVFKAGGFNCVIGNPPYVRQELLTPHKDYLKRKYGVYHGVADLYAYFFERGLGILAPGGRFGFIVANKWMRANYGEPLRRWLKTAGIEKIIDFGDLPVFENATTYPCIVIAENGKKGSTFKAVNAEELAPHNLSGYLKPRFFKMNLADLNDAGWMLVDTQSRALMEKLRTQGVTLDSYVDGRIYYGIKTGLNEAFVIDTETKERLIAEDPKSAEIIKPFLAGRDIKRYMQPTTEKWLIFTRRGIKINEYPAIERHLLRYKKQLMPKPKDWKGDKWPGRKPGSYKWYEVQDSIDYWREFEKPKIIYAEIAQKGQFTFDNTSLYVDTTAYIMGTTEKWLIGLFNSRLWTFIFSKVSSSIRGGYYRWKYQYMEQLPVPTGNEGIKVKIAEYVKSRMETQECEDNYEGSQAQALSLKIEALEAAIDDLVFKLYGLNEDEIEIIKSQTR